MTDRRFCESCEHWVGDQECGLAQERQLELEEYGRLPCSLKAEEPPSRSLEFDLQRLAAADEAVHEAQVAYERTRDQILAKPAQPSPGGLTIELHRPERQPGAQRALVMTECPSCGHMQCGITAHTVEVSTQCPRCGGRAKLSAEYVEAAHG